MQVYINYPNPHFTIHNDSSCQQVHMHRKEEQRQVTVRPENLKSVLSDFINENYDFRSEKQFNDLWLDISLAKYEQEIGLVYIIQSIIGQRYKPLSNAPINTHCP